MDEAGIKSGKNIPRDKMKDEVLSLISRSQNFDLLLNEISSMHQTKITTTPHPAGDFMTGICSLPIFGDKSLAASTGSSFQVTEQCAHKLITIIKGINTHSLTDARKTEIQSVLVIIRHLCGVGTFNKPHFEHLLWAQPVIPLELVWMLHDEGIVSLESFMKRSSDVEVIVAGVQQLMETSCVSGILTEMVNIGFDVSRSTEPSVRKLAIAVMDKIVLDFIDDSQQPSDATHPLVAALCRIHLDMESMKATFSHLISTVISHKPVLKVSQAIRQQSQWAYGKTAKDLVQFYKQMLLPFDLREVLQLLRNILEGQEVNWQLLLSFVSTIIVCLTDAPAVFLEFTDGLLREGLDDCDFEAAIMGMLLVRQACLQGPHVFLSYADWFQRKFSDSSKSLANNRKSFTFFMKFLTDLVPYESAQNIKVHILRPPFVPAKCRQLLSDYIILAKTRLSDLKESLDEPVQMDGGLKPGDVGQVAVQACSDVEKAVSSFSCTGKVPSFIMEASIFRKPYYISQFLPALLKPRPRPDIPDAKMKLIETLKKADKIPMTMYNNYDKACEKEAAQLLEGVFLDLDSDEDMDLDPMDQLDHSLTQLTAAITCLCSGIDGQTSKCTVVEAVSLVCERVGTVLSVSPCQDTDREPVITLNVDHPAILAQHLQVVEKLLNCITDNLQTSYDSANPQFTWLATIITGISQYGELFRSLCHRIWTLLVDKGLSLEETQINSLAAILVEMQLLGDLLPRIQLSGSCAQCQDKHDLSAIFIDQISIGQSKWMVLCLSFITAYLKYGYSSHAEEESVFACQSVVKKFTYLAPRLVAELRHDQQESSMTSYLTSVISLYRSKMVQSLMQKVKFSLADWVCFEVSVDPRSDIFTDIQRHAYQSWVIYQHFLPRPRDDGGFCGDYRAAASDVLQGILKQDVGMELTKATCPSCRAGRSADRVTNRCQMTSLLNELTQLLPYCEGDEAKVTDMLPWLPGQLRKMLLSENKHEEQVVVHIFFRMAVLLPSYLMYRDTHITPHDEHRLDAVLHLLNDVLVDHVCDGILLPVGLSVYLVQGLLSPVWTPTENMNVLNRVCEMCPLAALSFSAHYAAVRPIIDLHCRSMTPVVMAMVDWVMGDHQASLPDNSWHCSVAVYTCTHRRRNISLEDVLTHIQQGLDEYKFKEVVVGLAHLLLLHFTYCHFYSFPQDGDCCSDLSNTIETVLHLHGSLIIGDLFCCDVWQTMLKAVHKKYIEIEHLALMRVLCDISDEDLCMTIAAGHLDGLLGLFTRVGKSFEMVKTETDIQGAVHQPLTLEDVISYSKFVKGIILRSPPDAIRGVGQGLLRECGPDILQAAQTRLQSSSRAKSRC